MKPQFGLRTLPIIIAGALALAGCADREAIRSAEASLELAEMKGDLDGVYLALRKLDELGDKTASGRLSGVKLALESRETMLRAVADHDHEAALLAANDLLDQVPDNKEGLQTLRKSGQIFFYLQSAAEKLNSFELILEEPEAPPERVAWTMPGGVLGEEQQAEMNKMAQVALKALGMYWGAIDGEIGPGTQKAIDSFVEGAGVESSGAIDAPLLTALRQAAVEKEMKAERLDQLFHNLASAKDYISRAKELDPSFKNSIQLEEMADGALETLIYFQATAIIDIGQSVVQEAGTLYDKTSQLMSMSARLPPSVIWKEMGPRINKWRETAVPRLSEMDRINRRLANYSGTSSEKFVKAVNDFALAANSAVDAFTVPTGNLMDYRRAASEAVGRYRDTSKAVINAMPTGQNFVESVKGLATALETYEVYSNPTTKDVVDAHIDKLTT